MALNSLADQIVEAIKAELETLDSLKTVTRKPPSQDEFEKFASTQMPIAIIMGGLPSAESSDARRLKFKSILPVSLTVFITDNVDPGKAIYNVADDIYALLNNLPKDDRGSYLGGLVYQFDVIPEQVFEINPPYASFRYDVEATYFHSNRSI